MKRAIVLLFCVALLSSAAFAAPKAKKHHHGVITQVGNVGKVASFPLRHPKKTVRGVGHGTEAVVR